MILVFEIVNFSTSQFVFRWLHIKYIVPSSHFVYSYSWIIFSEQIRYSWLEPWYTYLLTWSVSNYNRYLIIVLSSPIFNEKFSILGGRWWHCCHWTTFPARSSLYGWRCSFDYWWKHYWWWTTWFAQISNQSLRFARRNAKVNISGPFLDDLEIWGLHSMKCSS